MHCLQRLLWLLMLAGFSCAEGAAASPLAEQSVWRFDAGPQGAAVDDQSLALSEATIYTPAAGYGWTEPPQTAFARDELARSRSPRTIDGVAGARLGFRADVARGAWHVILWIEAGATEQAWPEMRVQGRRVELAWQQFRPPAEPRRSPEKTCRLVHTIARVGEAGLELQLVGGPREVRLLGMLVIRRVDTVTEQQRQFLDRLKQAGHYRGNVPLDEFRCEAAAALRRKPADAFYAYWHHRLELLARAERYYAMRGWEWAKRETGLGMFDRHYQTVMWLDGLLMDDSADAGPFIERAQYWRGQMLYWLGREDGGRHEIAGATRDLERLAERHPDDELLAMYTGAKIDTADACDCLVAAPAAPDWSIAQREALCRLRRIVDWWVRERQSETGELGGKPGDDVELLRWWAPLCLVGNPTALAGWQRLADGVWQSEHIHEGYARKVSDVEHAAEFIADTAPLMALYSDDPRYTERLVHTARHFESLWTGVTPRGNRFFRSAWFSSTAIDTEPPKGRDVEYNTRAVQAMRYLARRRPDAKVIELLHQWSLAWTSAALQTDKGKPRGIVPASIRFADEEFNGDGENWYQADMFWDYYEWEHFAGSLVLDQLLFTYLVTDDEQLLEPMHLALGLIRAEGARLPSAELNSPAAGSAGWAASKLAGSRLFWNVVEQWRFLTGDSRWDDLIFRFGTAYGRYRLTGNERHLTDGLETLLEDVRYNLPLKTTAALYTDRVYVAEWELVKAMLTGDGIYNNVSPYHWVSWEETDDDFTALVRNTSRESLVVEVFSHAASDRRVVMRLWQPVPGKFRLHVSADGQELRQEEITLDTPGERVRLSVPGRQLVTISLERED